GNGAAASTRRILFVWQNDNNTGTNPPAGIDNISLTSNTPPTVVNMSNGSISTCNATFYDSGNTGNYTNNQNLTYTFCPATAGQFIRASFTSWGVEANFDYLSVFDGNSTAAPMIVGSSFSATSPGTITATTNNASGCLTFKFFSDGGTVGSGWVANVTCVATGATPPSSITAQDCQGAYTICSGANFNYQSLGSGIFNDANSGLGNRGCLNNYANTPNGSAEHQSVWAVFSPATNGTIGMTLDPAGSSTTDYDWAIWGPFTGSVPCPPQQAPLRCSAASANNSAGAMTGMGNGAADVEEGAGGNGWVSTINVTAGQLYLIMVDNWNATSAPLTLSWQLTNGATLDCTPLPIELVTFTGKAKGKNNYLEWITASEINNDYFTIERSIDGTNYSEIGTIKGSGTSHETKTYSTIDYTPSTGINYYRLKQTDFDGGWKYSGIVAINTDYANGSISNIHPNPTNSDINFEFNAPLAGSIYLQVFDYTGRLVTEDNMAVSEGNNSLQTSLNNLAKGIYSMKVSFNQTGFSSVTKIVKQ
ncbi:MAG: T9SS type A sorting domain-containing protein, partial [Bacteroidia bacterium]|nr:T9SS type A sorting domain-containing protein [Bacteroidia bacterium]